MQRLAPPVLALALVLALAACGGGSRPGAHRPARPAAPRSAFARGGDAICRAYYRKVGALARSVTAATRGRVVAAMLDAGDAETSALARLRAPATKRPLLAGLVAQARRESTLARRALLPALRHRDAAGLGAATVRLRTMDRRYGALARALGLDVCADPRPRAVPT